MFECYIVVHNIHTHQKHINNKFNCHTFLKCIFSTINHPDISLIYIRPFHHILLQNVLCDIR